VAIPSDHRPTLDDLVWPVPTSRLVIRRADIDDAGAVFAYRSLESVAQWLSTRQIDPDRWVGEWRTRIATTLAVTHDDELIGDMRIEVRNAHSQTELTAEAERAEGEVMWAFHPEWHGQGYATEAVAALIDIAFTGLKLRRVIACCYADNDASWRLMERVGMRREGHSVRSTLHRDGTWRDFLTYGLLAAEAADARTG
jgi:RimJ/RimL family protein N-acetyltransferase